ncbi:MAG TPA: ABC transporter substrate-binding protein [Candidatus Agrococcus pullicola]|uniref:ABC transporter substrate-binding protein n=1 Tax=Candidatus Agrococcus pullicola TaxID=2838429 RepID=A0A9D1YVQ7_9MICO|nr:ABC transporter substrate-binding protein [Candidatus Agrococcus pullicola]
MTLTLTRRFGIAATTLVLGAGLTLTACSSDDDAETGSTTGADATDSAAAGEASYPRTVTIDGEDVELTAKPENIAVLSSDLAALVLPLTGGDNVTLAPDMNATGDLAEELDKVENSLPPSASVDAEQVMASDPDLVMITARHDFEKNAADQLRSFDIPVAVSSGNAGSGSEAIIDQIGVVADLVGEQEKGAELAAELTEKRDENIAHADGQDAPSTLGIWAHANQQMIGSKTLMLTGLIREAGGDAVIDNMGAESMVSADPEVIVKEAPEVIIVQTSSESGEDAFAELIDNPAMKDVPAIKNDRVYYIDSSITSSASGTAIIDGLDEVSQALFEE